MALPFDKRPDLCKRCNNCIEVCPMTITPCPGPQEEPGICGLCESQTTMVENISDTCVMCELGRGFQCVRWQLAGLLGRAQLTHAQLTHARDLIQRIGDEPTSKQASNAPETIRRSHL